MLLEIFPNVPTSHFRNFENELVFLLIQNRGINRKPEIKEREKVPSLTCAAHYCVAHWPRASRRPPGASRQGACPTRAATRRGHLLPPCLPGSASTRLDDATRPPEPSGSPSLSPERSPPPLFFPPERLRRRRSPPPRTPPSRRRPEMPKSST